MKRIIKNLSTYSGLLGIIFLGFLGFKIFSYDRVFQAIIAVSVAAAYVIWGVVHHAVHKDIETSIVIEYVVIASLGLIVVLSIVLR